MGEEMLTTCSFRMENCNIRHISDVVEIFAGNVVVTNDSEVSLLDHEYAASGR